MDSKEFAKHIVEVLESYQIITHQVLDSGRDEVESIISEQLEKHYKKEPS